MSFGFSGAFWPTSFPARSRQSFLRQSSQSNGSFSLGAGLTADTYNSANPDFSLAHLERRQEHR